MLPKINLILALSVLFLTSGCASLSQTFENRLAVTAAGDELLFVSKYGPIGIATPISNKDRDALRSMTAAPAMNAASAKK